MIDDITFRESYPRLEFVKRQLQSEMVVAFEDKNASAAPENIHLLNILNAQEKESFISIIKALERGECIFVYVDGNTGWDGVWGGSSKSAIDFLGFPIAAKNGIPRLAAATGAPILPLVTVKNDTGGGDIIYSDPILPLPRMAAEEKNQFVLQSMKAIYKLLEDHALKFIDQWSSSCFLHRWRTPAPSGRAVAPTLLEVEDVAQYLNGGNRFKINEARIAGLAVKDDNTLIDVKTLKIYKVPEEARNLFFHLLQEEGLNSVDLSAMNGGFEGRQKILTLLAYLKRLEVIVAV